MKKKYKCKVCHYETTVCAHINIEHVQETFNICNNCGSSNIEETEEINENKNETHQQQDTCNGCGFFNSGYCIAATCPRGRFKTKRGI